MSVCLDKIHFKEIIVLIITNWDIFWTVLTKLITVCYRIIILKNMILVIQVK